MIHPDLEVALDTLLQFVQQFLAQAGSFPPFGVLLKTEGEPSFVAANFYELSGEEMLDLVKKGLHEGAAQPEVKAVGLCCAVDLASPSSPPDAHAICFELEHREGVALRVNVPWSKEWFGKIKLGKRSLLPAATQFFTERAADNDGRTSGCS
jgi:hypothetical protein